MDGKKSPISFTKNLKSTSTTSIAQKDIESCCLFLNCCPCITLKTGCYIVGYFSLALNFLVSVFYFGILALLSIFTHGFTDMYVKLDNDGSKISDMDSNDKFILQWFLTMTIFVGFLNVAWFIMNIVLLIGLHRNRAGQIKLYMTVATIRIVLSMVCLFLYKYHTLNSNIICISEIGVSTYFILLYYRFAVHLEQTCVKSEKRLVSDIVADVVFQFPDKISQTNLTEKEDRIINA